MKGELVLVDSVSSDEEIFEISVSPQDFSMNVYVDDENTLEKQLKNRKTFDYCMKALEEYWELDGEVNEDVLKDKEYIEKHFDNLLDSVEYIKLSFNEHDNMDFIRKNPIILTKKIVLNEMLDITDYDKLMSLMNEYKDVVDKIYVSLSGNSNYVSLITCYKTMTKIKEQAEKIKKLELSPMETIMYVYDQVRNRVYEHENKDESRFKSRDLSEVMFGDKIVCAGYSNIFTVLLDYIGIKSSRVILVDKNDSRSGHARNVVYVKDDKYDIDGVYYFDPTWDSKGKNETNEFLNRYSYFAKTKKYMDDNTSSVLEDKIFSEYSPNMDETIKEIIMEKNCEDLLPYANTLNYMSSLVTHTRLVNPMTISPLSPFFGSFDKEEFLSKFEMIFPKFNKEIPAETMLKIFNNVRKIEYYQNPELYPYSLGDMYNTCMNSNWQFADRHLDSSTKVLEIVFNTKKEIDPDENFKNYGYESGIFKEFTQVKLAKTLRLACDKKIDMVTSLKGNE